MAENQTKEMISLEEDRKVREYSEKLRSLRADGITKINDCKAELASLKKNKLIAESDRARRVAELNSEIEKAKAVDARNKSEITALSKEAVAYVNSISKEIEAAVDAKQNKRMEGAKSYYEKEVEDIKRSYADRENDIKTRLSGGDPQILKSELEICSYELKSALYDAKSRYKDQIDKCKAAKHQAFVDHIQKNRDNILRCMYHSSTSEGFRKPLIASEYLHDTRTGFDKDVLCTRCCRPYPPCRY